MTEQAKTFQFKVNYQYKAQNRRHKIFESITNHFILPFWIKKIQIEKGKQGGKAIQFQALDTRYFRYQNESSLSFLYHDEQQLKEYLTYQDYPQEDQKQLKITERQFLQLTSKLYYYWNYSKLVLDQMVQKKLILFKNQQEFQLGLFRRTITTQKGQKKRENKYLLVRQCQQPQKDSYIKMEKNFIIQLQNCQEYQNALRKLTKDIEKIKKQQVLKQNSPVVFKEIRSKNKENQTCEKLYTIEIKCLARKQHQQLQLTKKIKKQLKDQGLIKSLTINFEIKDYNNFFQNQITKGLTSQKLFQEIKKIDSQIYDDRGKNKIGFPSKYFVHKSQKKTFTKHYSLAFQGGGAKGLAYVGAYRALKQMEHQKKQIPVKSIMGSSAGGIIALGVSTGIPNYELQKVCYKMKMIPSTDRFVTPKKDIKTEDKISDQNTNKKDDKDHEDPFVPSRDLYGLLITLEDFKQSLKDLLDQYGLLSEDISDKIGKFLQTSEFEVVQQKLIRFLQAEVPTIGQILKYEQQIKQLPQKFFLQKMQKILHRRYYYPKENKKIKINWEGLLLHGALMKGQAIHDIAAQILLKFFLKQHLILDREKFVRKVFDSFYTEIHKIHSQKKQLAKTIISCIQNHKKQSKNLLNMPIDELKKFYPQKYREILITIVNRFIILINRFSDEQYKNFSHQEINLKPLVQMFGSKSQSNKTSFLYYSNSYSSYDNQLGYYLLQALQNLKDYNSINSVLDKVNLINHHRFGSKARQIQQCNISIKGFLNNIFPNHYKMADLQQFQLQKRQKHQITYKDIKRYFLALQGAEAVSQVIDFFYDKTFKQQQNKLKKPKAITDYQKNYNEFLQQMKKITLRQYYALTGIEMTCTSVDLDDRILRFFNHKTTPNLPVCRSVQMTGSFPVAFKAQRWKQEWGYYNVYLSRKRIQIDLTQHQFTDGGLLANFPIKYLDNADIRRNYFAHEFVQNKTLLYGFGLDFLDVSKYKPSVFQSEQILKDKDQVEIAWQDLITYLKSSLIRNHISKLGLQLLFGKSKHGSQWSNIYHKIIQTIPLLRFLVKLVFAYPNADRNLNLQVFQTKVTVHELEKPFDIRIFEEQYRFFRSRKTQRDYLCKQQFTRQQLIDRGYLRQFGKFYEKYSKRVLLKKINIQSLLFSSNKINMLQILDFNEQQLNRQRKQFKKTLSDRLTIQKIFRSKIKLGQIKKQYTDRAKCNLAIDYNPALQSTTQQEYLGCQKAQHTIHMQQLGYF